MATAQVLQHISNVRGSRKAVTVRFLLRSPLLGDAEMTSTKQYRLPSKITEQEEREAAWAEVRERAVVQDVAFAGVEPTWEPIQSSAQESD